MIQKYKVSIMLFIWTVVISLFCNIDSYLYAQCGQFDSSCFFMAGKAMMKGLIPYDDFADSKGVLLWFIYGIGYWIDHYSYIGVFWLACINLWGTLMISYKTARLWLEERLAMLAAMSLIVPLTYWNFYCETKAEHFCWPAVAWGLYVLLRQMQGLTVKTSHYIGVGVGVIACLMLKWSVAAMMVSFVGSIGWWAWRQRSFKTFITGTLSGLSLASLPFAIAFTCWNNWDDMWREYFVNTLATVNLPFDETLVAYSKEIKQLFTSHRFIYLLYTLPALWLWRKQDWFATALPTLCGLFFIALSIRHDGSGHYLSVVGPFAIVAIVYAITLSVRFHVKMYYVGIMSLLSTIYVIWGSIHYTASFCTKAGDSFDSFMAASAVMSKVDEPRIIVIGLDLGLCMASSLPGTRYWITQKGKSEQMWNEQLAAIRSGSADFIIFFDSSAVPILSSDLQRLNYHYLTSCHGGVIYSKTNLQMPTELKHFTVRDIVLKKTYTEMYRNQISKFQ